MCIYVGPISILHRMVKLSWTKGSKRNGQELLERHSRLTLKIDICFNLYDLSIL